LPVSFHLDPKFQPSYIQPVGWKAPETGEHSIESGLMKAAETQQMDSMDWREIVFRGVETQELDYKAAQHWTKLPRVGKAKFARHAMALANTRGGYVVVGVGEDENGNPTDYQGLDEDQLRSFDPSIVGQFINLYADPSIDFDIARPLVDGKYYAILVVRRFTGLPHVSSDHCGDELQQGAFYIRTPDARSRPAYRASELQGIIQRALRNQREVLGRMLRGVLYEGRQFAEPDAERQFQKQLQSSLEACRKWLGPRRVNGYISLVITAYPEEFSGDTWTLSDVRRAVENIALPIPGLLPLPGVGEGEAFATNRSFTGRFIHPEGSRFHFFEAFQSGLLHHVLSTGQRKRRGAKLSYKRLVPLIATALRAIAEFYENLGVEDDLITFTVGINNVGDCDLTDVAGDASGPFRCHIPDITVRKRRTSADLVAGTMEHTVKVVREVCERFNLPADQHPGLRKVLQGIFK
jgi:hypothetical protein